MENRPMTHKATKLYRLTPRQRLWRTACHKAGHAVIGRALGQLCGHTTIEHDLAESEVTHGTTADPWTTMSAWDAIGRWRDYNTIMHGRIMAYMAGVCGLAAAPCRVTSAGLKVVPLVGQVAAAPTDTCANIIDPTL